MIKLFGYDFTIATNTSEFKVIGLENKNPLFDSGVVSGTHFLLNGLNAELVKKLRKGEAYLEFWIEAIDHTKPTANNKLYPADVFQAGLESKGFQNQLRLGGVPGRFALLYGNI